MKRLEVDVEDLEGRESGCRRVGSGMKKCWSLWAKSWRGGKR
jgi:hypothetical protein